MAGGERKADEIASNRNLAAAVVAVIAASSGAAGELEAPKWARGGLAVAVVVGTLVLLWLHFLEWRATRREARLVSGAEPRPASARVTRTLRILWPVVVGAVAVTIALLAYNNDTPRLDPEWRIAHRRIGGLTEIRITVRRVPAGATLELRCSGTDCERTARLVRYFPKSVAETSLNSALRGTLRRRTGDEIRLHPATRIEIRVTKPSFVGEGLLVEITRSGPPKYTEFCADEEGKRDCPS